MIKLKNKVISIYNRKTSMRLADEEWMALDAICKREHLKRKQLLEMIEDNKDKDCGLTCFVRLFTITYMHKLAAMAGFQQAPYSEHEDIYQTLKMIS